jgi:hypothetical protein
MTLDLFQQSNHVSNDSVVSFYLLRYESCGILGCPIFVALSNVAQDILVWPSRNLSSAREHEGVLQDVWLDLHYSVTVVSRSKFQTQLFKHRKHLKLDPLLFGS